MHKTLRHIFLLTLVALVVAGCSSGGTVGGDAPDVTAGLTAVLDDFVRYGETGAQDELADLFTVPASLTLRSFHGYPVGEVSSVEEAMETVKQRRLRALEDEFPEIADDVEIEVAHVEEPLEGPDHEGFDIYPFDVTHRLRSAQANRTLLHGFVFSMPGTAEGFEKVTLKDVHWAGTGASRTATATMAKTFSTTPPEGGEPMEITRHEGIVFTVVRASGGWKIQELFVDRTVSSPGR